MASVWIAACPNVGSDSPPATEVGIEATASSSETDQAVTEEPTLEWAVGVFGGAFSSDISAGEAQLRQSLTGVLRSASESLADGAAAIEVAETAVMLLEDDAAFNAGRGATFTSRGTHEQDAAIVDGRSRRFGAISGSRNVRNPVHLARRIMERWPTPLVVGSEADRLATELRSSRAPQDYFTTQAAMQSWQTYRRAQRSEPAPIPDFGGVGVVVLDRYGNLAAAVSSGGVVDRRSGTPGASALPGAAVFADNSSAAVVACGRDAELIGRGFAQSVAERLRWTDESLDEATGISLGDLSAGCLMALDLRGRSAFHFSTEAAARAFADAEGEFSVQVGSASPFSSSETASLPAPTTPSNEE